MNSKNPWLAVNLSIFFPGIGQLYAGEILRGLILSGIEVILIAIAAWSLFSPTGSTVLGCGCLLPILLVYIGSIFDAHTCVQKQSNSQQIEKIPRLKKDPWFAVFLSQILPGLGHFYSGKVIVGTTILSTTIILLTLSNIFSNLLIFTCLIIAIASYHSYVSFPRRQPILKQHLIAFIAINILIFRIFTSYFPIWLQQQVEAFQIPSESMLPTLQVGDRILVTKSPSYQPKTGDLIVFEEPENLQKMSNNIGRQKERFFIKRVIGKPQDTIEISDGKVYINSQPIQESYIAEPPLYKLESMTVPANSYLVLGDNRNKSFDSHVWGFLPKRYIVGKAYKIFWPPERIKPL